MKKEQKLHHSIVGAFIEQQEDYEKEYLEGLSLKKDVLRSEAGLDSVDPN